MAAAMYRRRGLPNPIPPPYATPAIAKTPTPSGEPAQQRPMATNAPAAGTGNGRPPLARRALRPADPRTPVAVVAPASEPAAAAAAPAEAAPADGGAPGDAMPVEAPAPSPEPDSPVGATQGVALAAAVQPTHFLHDVWWTAVCNCVADYADAAYEIEAHRDNWARGPAYTSVENGDFIYTKPFGSPCYQKGKGKGG